MRISRLALPVLVCLASIARAEIDPCLVGDWVADNGDVGAAFAEAFGGGEASVSGQLLMSVTASGAATLRPDELVMDFLAPGHPPMRITFSGQSESIIETDGRRYATGGITRTMKAVAEARGQLMAIPGPPEGYRTYGFFACDGSDLALSPDGPPDGSPRLWRRLR